MSYNIAQAGFKIAMTGVNTIAHNVANVATPGYRTESAGVTASAPVVLDSPAQPAALLPSNVNLAEQFVELAQAQRSFEANVKVVETTSDMNEALLNATRGPLEF